MPRKEDNSSERKTKTTLKITEIDGSTEDDRKRAVFIGLINEVLTGTLKTKPKVSESLLMPDLELDLRILGINLPPAAWQALEGRLKEVDISIETALYFLATAINNAKTPLEFTRWLTQLAGPDMEKVFESASVKRILEAVKKGKSTMSLTDDSEEETD